MSKRPKKGGGKRPAANRSDPTPIGGPLDQLLNEAKEFRRDFQRAMLGRRVIDIDVASAAETRPSGSGALLLGNVPLIKYSVAAGNVKEANEGVLSETDGKPILRRLRFYGHGVSGGGIVFKSKGVKDDDLTDDNLLTLRYKSEKKELLHAHGLKKLKEVFMRTRFLDGWVEFHSCNVAAWESGKEFIRTLADMWDVRVYAGIGIQRTSNSKRNQFGNWSTMNEFEGMVFIADGRGGTKPVELQHLPHNARLMMEGWSTGTEW